MLENVPLLTWAIACGGWVVAIFVAYLGYAERKAIRESDLLLKTVSYFEGGTQKRSIGLSLLEGLISQYPKHTRVVVPLLANQFVYLLLHPEVKDSPHEARNLVRIFNLISTMPHLRQQHHYEWCETGDAIYRRLNGEGSGLFVAEPTLQLWLQALGHERVG